MVHKLKKGYYYLEWRPVNPDGTSVGNFVLDPTFEVKGSEHAWMKYLEHTAKMLFAEARLMKDGKPVFRVKKYNWVEERSKV